MLISNSDNNPLDTKPSIGRLGNGRSTAKAGYRQISTRLDVF